MSATKESLVEVAEKVIPKEFRGHFDHLINRNDLTRAEKMIRNWVTQSASHGQITAEQHRQYQLLLNGEFIGAY